jgi:hypothetical protein
MRAIRGVARGSRIALGVARHLLEAEALARCVPRPASGATSRRHDRAARRKLRSCARLAFARVDIHRERNEAGHGSARRDDLGARGLPSSGRAERNPLTERHPRRDDARAGRATPEPRTRRIAEPRKSTVSS